MLKVRSCVSLVRTLGLTAMTSLAFALCIPAMANEVVFLSLEYPPYASESMPDDGAMIEVLRQALADTEWTVKVRFVPWARGPAEIKIGNADGALPLWPNEMKAFGLIPTKPVFESRLGFFVRQSDWATSDVSLAKMAGRHVCTVRGYGYPEILLASGVVRDDANDDEANLKRMTMNRCDATALERAVGEYMLSKNKPWFLNAPVAWKDPPFASLPLLIGITPNRPHSAQLLATIEAGIERMRKDGRFKAIVKRYSLDVPKESLK